MPGLSMETRSDPCSPLSADEDGSSDSEWRPRENRGTKRRQSNRDAARKSRQKTTKMADELHQELQRLERDNSSLQKEINGLQKDKDFYSSVLERHAPRCCLKLKPTDTTDSCSALSTGPRFVPATVSEPVPTRVPTRVPTLVPTRVPTRVPTCVPTRVPTCVPTHVPTCVPTHVPTCVPIRVPTCIPTCVPTCVSNCVPTCVSNCVPTCVLTPAPTSVSSPPVCRLSTSSLGLNTCPETSCCDAIPASVPSLYPRSTSRLSQHTLPQTSRCVPGPVPTHVPVPVSPLCLPSTSSLHQQTTSSIPTPVSWLGLQYAPRLDLHTDLHTVPITTPVCPPSTLQTSHHANKNRDRSGCVTDSSNTLLLGHPLPLVPPVSLGPSPSLAPELDPDLLDPGPVNTSLDIALFNDLTLVQLLEENDWLLNIQ